MTAPMNASMNPIVCPIRRPKMSPPKIEPPIPRAMVAYHGIGSGPGSAQRARPPTMKPPTIKTMIHMRGSLLTFDCCLGRQRAYGVGCTPRKVDPAIRAPPDVLAFHLRAGLLVQNGAANLGDAASAEVLHERECRARVCNVV